MSRLSELIAKLCPDGVEYRALGEVAELVRGSGLQKKDFSETGVGCIHYGQIHTKFGAYTDGVLSYVPEELAKKLTVIHPGDVVVAVTSEDVSACCKAVAWIGDVDVVTGGHCVVVRHNLDPKYLSYCFQTDSFYAQKKRFAAGVKVVEMRTDKLARIRIPVPPIEVQREVVRILDEYTAAHDELVRQLEEEMYLRERQHRDMRQALFDNCTGDIVTIGELFPFIRNGFVGTVSNHFSDREDGIRYLEGTNVHDGHISDNEEIYVTRDFHEAHLRSELKPTDIVVVQSGHVGECAVVGDNYAGGNCHALIVMSNGGRCDSQYVVQYLYSAEGKRQIDKMTTGGTVKHILASKIGRIRLPLPSETRQHEIVAIIGEMDRSYRELINSLQEELNSHILQLALVRNQLLSFPEKVA